MPDSAQRQVEAERKAALLATGALQRAIIDSATFSSIATDANGVIQIFNVGAERMLGYEAAEVINVITPADISDPAEVIAHAAALSAELGTVIEPGFEALVYKAARGLEDIYELTYVRKDGSRFPAVVSVTPLRDPGDAIIGYLLIGTDNSARKLAEDALRENTALLRTIHLHSIVSITDRAGRIVDVNDSFCRISGYSREELIGETHSIVNSKVQNHAFWVEMWHTIASGEPWRGDICNRAKDGTLYWVDSIIVPFVGEDGRTTKYISIRTDITASKRAEQAMTEAAERAERANLAKSEFLANLSHEIRTPMNAVVSLSYLLAKTELTAEQASFLQKIELASKSLLVQINDVLDLSKIEAGELMVERAPFSLVALLHELAGVMTVQADAKGIAFVADIPADLPAALEGDATRLGQVLTNLLTNAIKFTERGGVGLVVRAVARTAAAISLEFEVHDTGIGISETDQSRLFEPFAQADASTTRRYGGTGLGLSIVKRLATLMEGAVHLHSTLGVGSTFSVTLSFPIASADALLALSAPTAALAPNALFGIRVLVVDDSDINLEVTQRILELEGARVWLARNGQDALDFLRATPTAVDVVLMDVQMPILDGNDATRRIRGELGLASLPIFALTAGALSSERARAEAAGMDEFIVKPFALPALVSIILRHVRPQPPSLARRVGHPPTPACGAVVAAVPWPSIPGIDTEDVRERLRDDLPLFGSMLRRLLDEFSDVALTATELTPARLAAHARHVHKLKGGAGTLGAHGIYRTAAAAEVACLAGDAVAAVQACDRLTMQLRRLARSTRRLLPSEAAPLPMAMSSARVSPQALAELIELLHRQSLSALDGFEAMAPQLQAAMGTAAFGAVRGQIENLQFSEAAGALSAAGGGVR